MTKPDVDAWPFLRHSGEMGCLMRTKDWLDASVGLPSSWPQSLRTSLNLLLHSPLPGFLCWGEDRSTFYNDPFIPFAGNKHPQLLGRHIRKALPAIWTSLQPLIEKLRTTGITGIMEERLLCRNSYGQQELLDLVFSVSPLYDEADEMAGVICICTEKANQVRVPDPRNTNELNEPELQERVAERTACLQEESSLLDSILEASINGVFALDAVYNGPGEPVDFIFLKVNRQAGKLTGIDETMIGQRFLGYFSKDMGKLLFEKFCKVLETGEPLRMEINSLHELYNGWFDLSVVKRNQDGIVVTFTDISVQQETTIRLEEQRNLLDSILKYSPVGISVSKAIYDANGDIIDFQPLIVNDAAEAFTGITSADRISHTVLELMPAIKNSELFEKAVRAIKDGVPLQVELFNEENKRWLELSVVRIFRDHLINVFRDITEIKETQASLESSIEELRISNVELEQFAYVTSHDLQEPLRKIRYFTNVAGEQAGQDEGIQIPLKKVDESAKRMQGVIISLLEYSRLSSAGLRFEKVNLNLALQQVLNDFELLITEKKAFIEFSELPTIEANALQVNQLFFNLIGNALKFTKRNVPPAISIIAQKLPAERKEAFTQLKPNTEYLEIVLKDNGIGFHPDYAAKIFGVFKRLNDRSAYGGFGIGLSICKKVAEAHNGLIYAEGIPQEGATFTVILPVQQSQ